MEEKKLGLWQNTILGLAFMEPALSLLATFSLVLVAGYSWAAVPVAYLIAGIATIITAVSFAELIRAFPKAGSIWAFGAGTVGPRFGQFSVWIYLLELLVVPAAALIPVGFFAYSWLGIPPWITVLVSILIIAGLTIRGVVLSFRAIAVLFITEMAILVAFAVSSISWSMSIGTFSDMAPVAISPGGSLFGLTGLMIGATVAIFSYIGYESSATMADETKSPAKTIPRAIIITALIGTILYTFLGWAFVLAIPTKGLFSLLFYFNPVPEMAGVIWGSGLQNLINLAGMIGGFTAALASVTAASRLLQKLGEDKVFPNAFQRSHRKYATPIIAILFISFVALVLSEFAPWETIAYVIATGAIPAFIITNLLAFWHYRKSGYGPKNILLHVVIPWIGIALSSWFVVMGLPVHMKMLLVIWLVIGAFLVFLNSCFRPSAFCAGTEREKTGTGARWKSWTGLLLSVVVLVIAVLGFNLWFTYYSGGIQWWYIIAPYASGDIVATGLTIAFAVLLLALLGFSLSRRTVEAGNK